MSREIELQTALLRLPAQGPLASCCVLPHPDPLYRVEGDPERRADGIYDQMQPVGADEIVIETPEHNRKLEDLSDDQILLVMEAWRQRVEDLKRDRRFKYVSVYKNYGPLAGQEGSHAHSQITATTFVPRRILYELRAAREWYHGKGTLRFLRHRETGRAPGETHRGHAGRLCRAVPLCLARSVSKSGC